MARIKRGPLRPPKRIGRIRRTPFNSPIVKRRMELGLSQADVAEWEKILKWETEMLLKGLWL